MQLEGEELALEPEAVQCLLPPPQARPAALQ